MSAEEPSTRGFDPPPDDAERTREFLERHGGPGKSPVRRGQSDGGLKGWSEIEADDGCILRCDWSRLELVEEIRYSETTRADRS